jgi:hypothetical protein
MARINYRSSRSQGLAGQASRALLAVLSRVQAGAAFTEADVDGVVDAIIEAARWDSNDSIVRALNLHEARLHPTPKKKP